MSRRQRAATTAGLTLPLLVVIVLLLAVVLDVERIGAVLALVMILAGGFGVLAYVAANRRFLRRTTEPVRRVEQDDPVSRRQSRALESAAGHLLASPEAERLHWLGSLRSMPLKSILAHGLSSRSVIARDFFALRATGWRFDERSLHDLLAAAGEDPLTMAHAVGPCDPNDLVALSRLLLGPRQKSDDRGFARLVNGLALAQEATLSPANRLFLAQHLLLDGEVLAAREVLRPIDGGDFPARFLQLDLINPFIGAGTAQSSAVSEPAWLGGLGGVFRRAGLESPELLPSGITPFDRLHARVEPVDDDGPLVTVIMSCFEPGETLVTAVRSIVAQTWTRWELLIADDASPSAPDALFERVAAMDSRIRILRSPVNEGTYARRNDAIRQAHGDLITMHDSDDWAHPRRLEIQVRHLLAEPELIGNLSQSVRVSEDLLFVQPRGTTIRLTESSILFWKERARSLVGDFDSVRKAADSEFRLRLEAAVGRPIPLVDIEAPLSIVRFDPRSLSGSDLGDGWMHPARVAYVGAQTLWRAEVRAAGESLRLDRDSPDRPFPAHGHLRGTGPAQPDLDVVLLFDGRAGVGTDDLIVTAARELQDLAEAGVRVGFRRAEALTAARGRPVSHDALQRLVNRGVVTEVLPTDRAVTRLLVVRQVDALAGVSALDEAVAADEILLVASPGSLPSLVCRHALAALIGSEALIPRHVSLAGWRAELQRLGGLTGGSVST